MKLKWKFNAETRTHIAETDTYRATIAHVGLAPHSNSPRYKATIRTKAAPRAIVAVDSIIGIPGAKRWIEVTVEHFHKNGIPGSARRDTRLEPGRRQPRLRPAARHYGGALQ